MEIHKPKPIHNWREFLKEYAIIVLGVLTALAAEQAVEWLHWQSEVPAARDSIQAEITDNNTRLFARRVAFVPCIDRQIREADRILSDLEAGRKPASFTVFHPGSGNALSDSEWQSERAAQALTHLPRSELALMSLYYSTLDDVRGFLRAEGDAWAELSVLTNPPKAIGVSDLLRLRVALHTAQEDESLLVRNAQRELNRSRRLGIVTRPADPLVVRRFCTLNEADFRSFEPRD